MSTRATLLAADLDADGSLDLALLSQRNNILDIYLSQGHGISLVPTYRYGIPFTIQAGEDTKLAATDLDGDGQLDLAMTDYGVAAAVLNQGHGQFSAPPAVVRLSNIQAMSVVGDLNGDGLPDLTGLDPDRTSMEVRLNQGRAAFMQTGLVIPVGLGLLAGNVVDVNGDGTPDIVAQTNETRTAVLLGSVQ
jgi:hypothetical protein